MEKNNSSKILMIILLFACLGLGGFIFYDKVINKNDDCKKEEIKSITNTDKNNNVENKKSMTNQILIIKPGKIIVDKTGDVYFIIDKNYKRYSTIENAEGIDKIGKYGEYQVEGYKQVLDMDGDANIAQKFEGYKLNLSNIISAYSVNIGQDSEYYQTTFFVEENGTVDMLAFELGDTGKAILKKNVSEYANIVSITQSATFDSAIARLVDKDGNTYDLENYNYFNN